MQHRERECACGGGGGVCVLDGEGSQVFASRALVLVVA